MILTETGLISIITIGTAFLSACLGFCYKSKCSRIKMGCLEIDRDTKGELKEDLAEVARRRSITKSRSENLLNQV